MSVEFLPAEYVENVATVNNIVQRSYLLAAQIDYILSQGDESDEFYYDGYLPDEIYDEVEELNGLIRSVGHLAITFSGVGCVPDLLPIGEYATIYGHSGERKGSLSEIYITDPDYLNFYDLDHYRYELQSGGTESSLIDGKRYPELERKLVSANPMPKLYTEFIIDEVEEEDVNGSSITARYVRYKGIIESSSLQIKRIEDSADQQICPEDEIHDQLDLAARRMLKLIKDTAFRRLSKNEQASQVDSMINKMNEYFQIERFLAITTPTEIFVPELIDSNHRLKKIILDADAMNLSLNCSRIDSLEAFGLTSGLYKITNNSSVREPDVAFCLVGEVDKYTKNHLGLDSDIVWLPVRTISRKDRRKNPEWPYAPVEDIDFMAI